MNSFPRTVIEGPLDGYYAAPATGSAPGVIVMMEAFGLKPHIRDVCDRLAAAGFAALAPDILHGKDIDYGDREILYASMRALRDDAVLADIGASARFLARQPQVKGRGIGIIGFCMGGRYAFLANACLPEPLKAAVSLYGGGIAPDGEDRLGRRPPILSAQDLRAPMLLIYGGRDASIPNDEQLRVAERLGSLGKRYTLSLYPQAEHGFCCDERPSYNAEYAREALAESFEFLHRYLAA
jgi:carboxymethylenebutenolidase